MTTYEREGEMATKRESDGELRLRMGQFKFVYLDKFLREIRVHFRFSRPLKIECEVFK